MRERTRPPTHPGGILKRHYLEPLHIGIAQAALALGVSRQSLSKIVHEQRAVTPDMALRLGKAFHTTPELWLNRSGPTTCGTPRISRRTGVMSRSLSQPSNPSPHSCVQATRSSGVRNTSQVECSTMQHYAPVTRSRRVFPRKQRR